MRHFLLERSPMSPVTARAIHHADQNDRNICLSRAVEGGRNRLRDQVLVALMQDLKFKQGRNLGNLPRCRLRNNGLIDNRL